MFGDTGDLLKAMATQGIKQSLDQVVRLIELILTLPLTTSSVERSFSALKRIKSSARNKIADKRLSNLATLSIESRLTKEVNINDVIEVFANMKDRRLELRYK